MKKFFYFAAAVAVMAACSKEIPSTPAPSAPEDVWYESPAEEGAPMAVEFGSNVSVVKSKSQGAIDVWNAKQTLYIYGFNRNAESFADDDDILINNVAALSPASGMQGAIEVYNPKVSTEDYKEKFFYSGTTCYDFYGYYVDDAAGENPSPERAADAVTLDVAINGGQDIMLAKANQTVDVEDTPVDSKYAYSAYSARRNVKPNLKFEHQLTQFTFHIVDGDYDSEIVENPDYVSPVRIQSISLTSKVNGTLTIAGATAGLEAAEEEAVDLYLQKMGDEGKLVDLEDGVNYDPLKPEMVNDDIIPTNIATQIGTCLMVYPGEAQHTLKLTKRQVGKTDQSKPEETKITPALVKTADGAAVQSFEAGKSYKITLKVYRDREVEITAELAPWVVVGDIVIDPDDPSTWPENQN